MILKSNILKTVCSTILTAVDNSGVESTMKKLTETLELKTIGTNLYLNITNREYYASVKIALDHEEAFHSTVEANKFLKLIAGVTSDTVELVGHDTYLAVKANGTYKIPYIFDEDRLLELPEIVIDNPTVSMDISGDSLNSIITYNSKELQKASVSQPIQKLYYLDEQGCITFTAGACVNNFTLPKPVKVLLDGKVVKLFKLFKKDTVKFTLGYHPVNEKLIQTRVCFETDGVKLTAITPSDDNRLARVPVDLIRKLASKNHDHKVVLNTTSFLEALNRLALFNTTNAITITTNENSFIIASEENREKLTPENGSVNPTEYTFPINLQNLKTVLEATNEQFVTVGCGDNNSVSITRQNIVNIIPENVRQ